MVLVTGESGRAEPLMPHVSFGIATAPQRVDYADLLRVWREADTVPRSSTRGCSTI